MDSLLSPMTGFVAAALTVPPLLLLYFLKLRRREVPISSTLLWKRAVQDLQVNAPFQRIRNNLLLWLQLLILLLGAFALTQPMCNVQQDLHDTVVLLIDQSASMSTVEDSGRTRLEIAKEQAKQIVDAMDENDRAMVIAFSDRARVAASFTQNTETLKRQIDRITPTESVTRLSDALALAEAYSQSVIIGSSDGTDVAIGGSAPEARAVLFSDGRIEDADSLAVRRLNMELVGIGRSGENVGITSLQVKRRYDRPELLNVFARVHNFGAKPVTTGAELYIEGELVDIKTVQLQPGVAPQAGEKQAGPATGSVGLVAFDDITYEGQGIVEVRLSHDDALMCDNRAFAVSAPPRRVSVLLVTDGNWFLSRVLEVLPIDLRTMTTDEYESARIEKLAEAGRSLFDVVILDQHSTDRLFVGGYFFFGAVPLIEGVQLGEQIDDEIIFNWDDSHPVLRYVSVENVQVGSWGKLSLPDEAAVLMESESGPVMALLARDGRQYLISAFGLLDEDRTGTNTTWVLRDHFPVFMYNALQYLSSNMPTSGTQSLQPGEALTYVLGRPGASVVVRRPDGKRDRLNVKKQNVVHYGQTRQVGVYELTVDKRLRRRYAVNLFSPNESHISPNADLTIGQTAVAASQSTGKVNQPFWQWFVLAALGVMTLEWIVYNKRVLI